MKRFIPSERTRTHSGPLTITFKKRGKTGSQAYLSASLAQELEEECKKNWEGEEMRWVVVYASEDSPLLAIAPTSQIKEGVEIEGIYEMTEDELAKALSREMRAVGALSYNPKHRFVGTEDLATRYKIPFGEKIVLTKTRICLPGAEQETTLWAGSLALEGAG